MSSDSPSFCAYPTTKGEPELMSENVLKDVISFAFKNDLSLHFLLPQRKMPTCYEHQFEGIDCVFIAAEASDYAKDADIVIFGSVNAINETALTNEVAILSLHPQDITHLALLTDDVLRRFKRLNIVIREFKAISQSSIVKDYGNALTSLAETYLTHLANGGSSQINVLSDRIFASSHLNCNAGIEHLTVSPDGRLYICPGFYVDNPSSSIGDIWSGYTIINKYLLDYDHAPICRNCDAFQCRRCVWLNMNMTGELNTPSKEQCMAAHIERNCSRGLLYKLREYDCGFMPDKEINEIDYLDPLELITGK